MIKPDNENCFKSWTIKYRMSPPFRCQNWIWFLRFSKMLHWVNNRAMEASCQVICYHRSQIVLIIKEFHLSKMHQRSSQHRLSINRIKLLWFKWFRSRPLEQYQANTKYNNPRPLKTLWFNKDLASVSWALIFKVEITLDSPLKSQKISRIKIIRRR